jgi:hypothetical protein
MQVLTLPELEKTQDQWMLFFLGFAYGFIDMMPKPEIVICVCMCVCVCVCMCVCFEEQIQNLKTHDMDKPGIVHSCNGALFCNEKEWSTRFGPSLMNPKHMFKNTNHERTQIVGTHL